MRSKMIALLAAAAAVALAGCSKSPDAGAKQTRLKVEEPSVNGGLNPSGRPEAPLIDPAKKTVVVLAAPSAPQLAAREEARIVADREKVEGRIHTLMNSYADNLGSTRKDKYGEQITQELDTYKRQSLQIFKLQQQAAQTARRDGSATPQ